MPHLYASDTPPADWKYVNEGGATIVLAYTGANQVFSGTALRLRKTPIDALPVLLEEEADDPSVAFQSRVTSRLLPAQNLPRLEIVQVTRKWLEELGVLVESDRPTHRRDHDRIDYRRSKGVLATNLVGPGVLTVEIKVGCYFGLQI
jgi:inositol-pentakisphosphate 2-kinase